MENALDALVEHGRMTVSDRDFLVASFDDSEALKTVYEEFLSSCNSDIFLKIVSVYFCIFIILVVILEKELSQLFICLLLSFAVLLLAGKTSSTLFPKVGGK
jgi:hypothetical protein